MPDDFWNWYQDKGYEQVLSKEECFKNKAFLVRCPADGEQWAVSGRI